jgi:hypothetical protein
MERVMTTKRGKDARTGWASGRGHEPADGGVRGDSFYDLVHHRHGGATAKPDNDPNNSPSGLIVNRHRGVTKRGR